MKSNPKTPAQSRPFTPQKTGNSSTPTAIAIGKKLLEIKRISGADEMAEMNMALWRHLK